MKRVRGMEWDRNRNDKKMQRFSANASCEMFIRPLGRLFTQPRRSIPRHNQRTNTTPRCRRDGRWICLCDDRHASVQPLYCKEKMAHSKVAGECAQEAKGMQEYVPSLEAARTIYARLRESSQRATLQAPVSSYE
jgi:hypothetical protein